ncbi:MAG: long-chain fatty acid--CoA ligase [Myxococcales bacterium]|nr:long-chain fatty acid--CoA ligase [Myxococcales bacterium]
MANTSASPSNLAALLPKRAAETPYETALCVRHPQGWQSMTWQSYLQQVMQLASALEPDVQTQEMVCLLSENRPEWVFSDMAILSLGAVTVPIYPTSSPKELAYILNDCKARLLLLSNQTQLEKILSLRQQERLPYLQKVVCIEGSHHCDGKDIFSWQQLLNQATDEGIQRVQERRDELHGEQLATLIYTSGTTGEPKGVMLRHRNILSNLQALEPTVRQAIDGRVRMLSFLPLSHAFERTIGHFLAIHMGFEVSFSRGIDRLLDELREVQPNFLVSVPSVYEEIYTRVLRETQSGSPLKDNTLQWCLEIGRQRARYQLAGQEPGFLFERAQFPLADRLLFRRVREMFGGKLQYAISGGAPLARDIIEFLIGAGVHVIEGYGLSETGPVLTVNPIHGVRPGSVGRPLPNVELKIVPEPGYEIEGEIVVRGPNVMAGYYNKEEETQHILDQEGWLRTGDIGYLDADGYVVITDRKKDLIKLATGKYVAPQPIERHLKTHPFIRQAVVLGDRRLFCVALLVPDIEGLRSQIPDISWNKTSLWLRDPRVLQLFQNAVDEMHQRLELGRWEQIKRFALLPAPLSQANGELTPTGKLKRRVIEARYKTLIDELSPLPETRSQTDIPTFRASAPTT